MHSIKSEQTVAEKIVDALSANPAPGLSLPESWIAEEEIGVEVRRKACKRCKCLVIFVM